MSLPAGAVSRPVTVSMAVLAVTIFGVLASRSLPVDLLPDIAYPTVTVETEYPDAAPVSVEQFVTRPIEEAVGVISGVREMRSVSRPGRSEVILEFDWSQEMDFAALEVRERLGTVQLPRETDVPRVLRFDPSLDPIVRVAFAGPRPLDELRQLADRWLKPRLEGVKGVAAAKVRGGLDPEVVVEADEDRLAAYGLTLDELADALEAENINTPGGTLRDYNALYLVRTLHEFEDLEQVKRTVVREQASGRVRVEDVARVYRGHRDREEAAFLDGSEVVELALYREGSSNTVQVAAAIREELAALNGEMPNDLRLEVLTDQSVFIQAAVDQVRSAALIGGVLAVIVLFFFLRDLLSTVIIALSIPVSVIATFLPMQQFGVSLNIMSLGGLALGIGMLVDSAIVVLEAIDRHRTEGADRRTAAIQGASEVAGAVTASIFTTVCVFLPIVFVEGIAGQLFRDQALTVCFSLIVSLIVALTLIPSLSAFDPKRLSFEKSAGETPPWTFELLGLQLLPIGDGHGLWSKILTVIFFLPRLVLLLAMVLLVTVGTLIGRLFFAATSPLSFLLGRIQRHYPGTLSAALKGRWVVIVIAVALFAGSIVALPLLGTQLVPDLAQGSFAFQLRLAEGTPLDSTVDTVSRVEDLLLDDERFVRVFSVAGSLPSSASGRRTLGENLAQIDLVLDPALDLDAQDTAVADVRDLLASFPRLEAELLDSSALSVEAPVAIRVFADDLDVLDEAAEIARQALATVAQVTDIATTSEPGSPEVQVTLDRDRASALGVTASEIGNALRRKIRGDIVGEFREGEERIDIRLRALEMFRDQASEVQDLRLRLDDGTAVPVSALARIEVGRGPAAIYRADGARMAEITAQVLGDDLGAVLDDVRATMAAVDVPVTANVQMSGQDEELAVSFNSLKLAVALAIFLVYVVMASQFESLLHPFVILMSVPLALVGVVASLFVTNNALSVLAMIGAVMLAGIVVNNAIVLVDAINRRRREGESLRDAVIGAGGERLRPILMTTATTVLGLLPMALGLGAGDELRAPLAITVIGGLAVATVLTLVVIPCIYVAVTREPLDGGAAKSRSTSTPERDPELDTDDERVLPAASVAT